MAILVIAAHDNKTVRANVANAVAAAGQMGSDVAVLVAGSNCGDAAKSAAAISGVTKVLQAEDPAYANWVAEDVAPLVVKLALLAPVFVAGFVNYRVVRPALHARRSSA